MAVTAGYTRSDDAGAGPGLRRIADVVGAAILLALALPLMAVAAVAVLVVDGRPVLFGHRRVGRGRRPFLCWKFRTMRRGAEEMLESSPDLGEEYHVNGFKLPTETDPRVLPGLAWLRRSYLDELPQLFNVLSGDMSLVGPRPVVEDELALFHPHEEELLSVRPGLFGAWTVLGRDRPPYPRRAAVELRYVRERTVLGDLAILGRSILVVLQGHDE